MLELYQSIWSAVVKRVLSLKLFQLYPMIKRYKLCLKDGDLAQLSVKLLRSLSTASPAGQITRKDRELEQPTQSFFNCGHYCRGWSNKSQMTSTTCNNVVSHAF